MQKPTRQLIPQNPGVYFFKKGRSVLYVGKASNLRNRTGQYFQNSSNLSELKQRLIIAATSLTWEETDTDIEALLLEAHYIKKLQPPYNILLRDDKTYVSVKITDEDFPKVLSTRKIEKDGIYFGPFTDARAIHETLRALRKFFPYRTTCKPNSGRACLDAHIGLCPGVCAGKITKAEYKKNIQHIKWFFEGKKGKVIKSLKQQLRKELDKERLNEKDLEKPDSIERGYEVKTSKADRLRLQIHYLEKVLSMQKVLSKSDKVEGDVIELAKVLKLKTPPIRIEGYDISNIYGTLNTSSMVVFTNGEADKKEYKKFKIKTVRGANDFASMQETLRRRFNHPEWGTPDLVVIDGGRPQLSAAIEVWKEYNLKIPLISLAKRREEIFTPDSPNPIVLPHSSGALHLVQQVRDEAHRFCRAYHRKLRHKKMLRK
jgi:excinuclease ABC subunit C